MADRVYEWEENFLEGEESILMLGNRGLGYVAPIDGLWKALYYTDVSESNDGRIAVRSDKASAQSALIKYHETKELEKP